MTPTNFRELLEHLRSQPRVRIEGPAPGEVREADFERYRDGRMWFRDGRFIPISCTLKPEAAASETGIDFDAGGFTVRKFGATMRVAYLPSGATR